MGAVRALKHKQTVQRADPAAHLVLQSLATPEKPCQNACQYQKKRCPEKQGKLRDGEKQPERRIKQAQYVKQRTAGKIVHKTRPFRWRGAGINPLPFTSTSCGVAQGSENTDANGQKPGGNAHCEERIAGHQVPALAKQRNNGIHRGHHGGKPAACGFAFSSEQKRHRSCDRVCKNMQHSKTSSLIESYPAGHGFEP